MVTCDVCKEREAVRFIFLLGYCKRCIDVVNRARMELGFEPIAWRMHDVPDA